MFVSNKQMTILIIDDNPTNLKVAVDYLKAYSYNILIARDGLTGVERAQRGAYGWGLIGSKPHIHRGAVDPFDHTKARYSLHSHDDAVAVPLFRCTTTPASVHGSKPVGRFRPGCWAFRPVPMRRFGRERDAKTRSPTAPDVVSGA